MIVEKSFLYTYSSLSKTPHDKNITPGTKTTVTQRQLLPLFFSTVNNGIAIKLYTCHNSGGQLLKKRQNEMFLTARLFRPGEATQSKQLRNQPGYVTDSC
ncbi:hypothetical protein T10_13079 [Trichinella papuae]|uniref:Uncharacterized protein n=1 Tax=Trichinella papuae TaxID=268474 RepID=A0A0V1MX43_9BILA|nr:hypothetical protein T10_13079 [Trichinella papuae]